MQFEKAVGHIAISKKVWINVQRSIHIHSKLSLSTTVWMKRYSLDITANITAQSCKKDFEAWDILNLHWIIFVATALL